MSSTTPSQKLKLATTLLESAQKTKDPKIALMICDDAEATLSRVKPSKSDEDQTQREETAAAYSELGKLLDGLGQSDRARINYKAAAKLGLNKESSISATDSVAAEPSSLSSLTLQQIFAENVHPPNIVLKFPEADERLVDTSQLACCLSLLQDSNSPNNILEPVARNWLLATEKHTEEQERLEMLATDIVRAFSRDELKDAKAVAEVAQLASVLKKDTFRYLLAQFYDGIDQSSLLDFNQLEGLAEVIQGAARNYLDADDLVKILRILSTRLRDTHRQSSHHIYHLTLAMSHVLDAMADTGVKDLDREQLHEPLSAYLDGLRGSSDPYLVFQAAYCYQALQYVPDNETPWQAAMRRTGKVIQGVSRVVGSVKAFDLNGFMEGLGSIQQGLTGVTEVFQMAKTAYKGVTSLAESGQDLLDCLKEGFSFDCKRAWYSALRGSETLLRGGQLAEFKKLVCEAPCRRDPAFQWGVCQRLGEIAANQAWDADTRRSAVAFLGDIYQDDTVWGQQANVKQWIIDILMQLAALPGSAMECTFEGKIDALYLTTEGDADKLTAYAYFEHIS
ncbi:hypothetical protein BGZ65_011915 [Modicella reniformis]|uniref:Arm-like repeat domain-containing protein n=1 Tax=Modicella reniformis TaxID=1440133 RepID=A0A9P6SUL4_9FUNG|nr:hypothetical protein BGZ65_011915 [Modicella reniformis]